MKQVIYNPENLTKDGRIGFRVWLRRQLGRGDAIGDLARDVAQDPDFPKGGGHLRYFVKYLTYRDASDECVAALCRAYHEYLHDPSARLAEKGSPQALTEAE